MNPTTIEYLTHTWSPIHGCTRGCGYCWAAKMAKRLAAMSVRGYDPADPMRPTIHEKRWGEPITYKKPSRIGVGFMGDLMDPGFSDDVIQEIKLICRLAHWHTFLWLTKRPARLRDFNPWPANCFVGASATDDRSFVAALRQLEEVEAPVRYISVEPMLGPVYSWPMKGVIEWLICGAQTRPERPPRQMWVDALGGYARRDGIPIFLKNNLHWPKTIQEYPTGAER